MTQSANSNRQIVLAARPQGMPNENTLRLEETDVPKPGSSEMLLRTVYLSLDPYMRGRMNDAKSYAEPVKISEVMTGQVVAEVVSSNLDAFKPGDHVLSGSGWQDYAVSDGMEVMNLGEKPENPSWSLGILGMPGYTAYAGLLKIGEPKPGETVVVAAASGSPGRETPMSEPRRPPPRRERIAPRRFFSRPGHGPGRPTYESTAARKRRKAPWV